MCITAFLRQSNLFWEIPSFWELGRLLLTALHHSTGGKHPVHVCDCGTPQTADVLGEVMGFPTWGSSSSQPQGYTQTLPKPRATQEDPTSSTPPSLGRSHYFLFYLWLHFLPCPVGCRWSQTCHFKTLNSTSSSGKKCLAAVWQDRDGAGHTQKSLSQLLGSTDKPPVHMETGLLA